MEALEKKAFGREKAKFPLRVDVRRLRSRHAGTILGSIFKRIEDSDILIFDISGNNPNVLFELGYAAAKKGLDSGNVYLFTCSKDDPSDLKGLMFTRYVKSNENKANASQFTLADLKGFQASLLGALTDIARERMMIGRSKTSFEAED